MTDPDHSDRLAKLESRLAKLRQKGTDTPHQQEHYSQAQHAWRMVIELVAGLMIGFSMGYGLDLLLGTLPIFLVTFTLLGLAAGIKTMMRSAEEMQKAASAPRPDEKTGDDAGEEEGDKNGDGSAGGR